MADTDLNSSSLVSIIKIEPEEFQKSEKCLTLNLDEILRRKANIFTDLEVALERVKFQNLAEIFKFKRRKNENQSNKEFITELVQKGNVGKTHSDQHTCSLCKKVFMNRTRLKSHTKNFHGQGPKMFCDFCAKTFQSKYQIRQHIKIHMEKAFVCNICDYKAYSIHILTNHKKTHLKQEKCKICNKQVASLKTHMYYHQKEACTVCGKIIIKGWMTEHMKTHDDGRFKCQDCDNTFSTREKLRRHRLEQHYKGELLRCHCGSVFKTKSCLISHQKSHDNRKFSCKFCKKKYKNFQYLQQHHKKHHLRMYGPIAKMIQKTPKVLNLRGTFICDKCGSELGHRGSFVSHFRTQHLNTTCFYCDLCPKSFKRKDVIQYHINSHFKVDPIPCKVCGRKYASKKTFRVHMLRHEPKTKCEVCHKMVSYMFMHMRSHLKRKHPKFNLLNRK